MPDRSIHWYIIGVNGWYIMAVNSWYIMGVKPWYIIACKVTAFDRGSLRVYAAQLALDRAMFETCLDSAAAAMRIEQDLADGRSYGVAATPTFFVNGRHVVGSVALTTFQREIEAALTDKP